MPHRWQVVDRLPLSLVRRACSCGCKGQRVELVTDDGRTFGFPVPRVGVSSDSLKRAGHAISLGRELAELWQRMRQAVR